MYDAWNYRRCVCSWAEFFKALAPATNNRLFFGRFIQGVHDEQLNVRFRYTYIQPKEKSLNFVEFTCTENKKILVTGYCSNSFDLP